MPLTDCDPDGSPQQSLLNQTTSLGWVEALCKKHTYSRPSNLYEPIIFRTTQKTHVCSPGHPSHLSSLPRPHIPLLIASKAPLKPIKEPTTVKVGLPSNMPSATKAQPLYEFLRPTRPAGRAGWRGRGNAPTL